MRMVILNRKKIRKQFLTGLALLILGVNLLHPFSVKAESSPAYLYLEPAPSNRNPMRDMGLFYLAFHPEAGMGTLQEMMEYFPMEEIVIDVTRANDIQAAGFISGISRLIISYSKEKSKQRRWAEKYYDKKGKWPDTFQEPTKEKSKFTRRDWIGGTVDDLLLYYSPKTQKQAQDIEASIGEINDPDWQEAKKRSENFQRRIQDYIKQ